MWPWYAFAAEIKKQVRVVRQALFLREGLGGWFGVGCATECVMRSCPLTALFGLHQPAAVG